MGGCLKKYMWILVLLLAAPGIRPAAAQLAPPARDEKPELTAPSEIAMIFHKLSGQRPDFESWVQQTETYKNANGITQASVLDREVKKLEDIYSLLTLQEPVIVEIPVKLSAYSPSNKGYFIENFKSDTYFPAAFNGRYYALVPQGIMDNQWLPVQSTTEAQAIEAAAQASKRLLRMVVMLTPKFADKSEPLRTEEADYWLIAASIRKMMLYPATQNTLLWTSETGAARERNQKLLNLYQ